MKFSYLCALIMMIIASPTNGSAEDPYERVWVSEDQFGEIRAHRPGHLTATISSDGKFIVSLTSNGEGDDIKGMLRLYTVAGSKVELAQTIRLASNEARGLRFSPDGSELLVRGDSSVATCKVGARDLTLSGSAETGGIPAVTYAGGSALYTNPHPKLQRTTVHWRGKVIGTLPGVGWYSAAGSKDHVAIAHNEAGKGFVMDLKTGRSTPIEFQGSVNLRLAMKGRYLAVASYLPHRVKIFEIVGGGMPPRAVADFGTDRAPHEIAFVGDTKVIAYAAGSAGVVLYDWISKEVVQSLAEEGGPSQFRFASSDDGEDIVVPTGPFVYLFKRKDSIVAAH